MVYLLFLVDITNNEWSVTIKTDFTYANLQAFKTSVPEFRKTVHYAVGVFDKRNVIRSYSVAIKRQLPL